MEFKKYISGILFFVKGLAFIILLSFILKTFVYQTYQIDGQSMMPNFKNGEVLIVDKISYRFRPPTRGEVLLFHPLGENKTSYIKRVVGLPGDEMEIKNGNVYINGKVLEESYLSNDLKTLIKNQSNLSMQTNLTDSQFFVMGDNRLVSEDSRIIGPVEKKDIIGRAFFVYWPVREIQFIKNPAIASWL